MHAVFFFKTVPCQSKKSKAFYYILFYLLISMLEIVFVHHEYFTTDGRYSCGSATPVSSDSSDSPSHDLPPPREPPPALTLDLLTEMEYLFVNKSAQRRDSFPNSSRNTEISLPDKAVSLKRKCTLVTYV